MKGHRLLLGFGILSLGISLALTLLILATGVTLLTEHLHPGARSIWPVLLFTCMIGGLCCVVLSTLQFVQLGAQRDAEFERRGQGGPVERGPARVGVCGRPAAWAPG